MAFLLETLSLQALGCSCATGRDPPSFPLLLWIYTQVENNSPKQE